MTILGFSKDVKHDLDEYVRIGRPTGDFLEAVLENDLMLSFARADENNQRDMFFIVKYVYNILPIGCYGNKERVTSWIERRGMMGAMAEGEEKDDDLHEK